MKKIGIIFFSILAIFLVVDRVYLLHLADKSLQDSWHTDFIRNHKANPPPVYLASYAGGHDVFYRNQNGSAMSAINNGIDFIHMYKRAHLDAQFLKDYKARLDVPRGNGLWVWKPYVVLKTMERATEGAIIIFADSPVIFHSPVDPLIAMLGEKDILLMNDSFPPKSPAPRLVDKISPKQLTQFGHDLNAIKDRDHMAAALHVYRNSPISRAFVRKWLERCKSGMPDTFAYEQTIMALTQYDFDEHIATMTQRDAYQVVKNIHRHPDDPYHSFLPDFATGSLKWFKFSELGYNSKLAKFLRSIFFSVDNSAVYNNPQEN